MLSLAGKKENKESAPYTCGRLAGGVGVAGVERRGQGHGFLYTQTFAQFNAQLMATKRKWKRGS